MGVLAVAVLAAHYGLLGLLALYGAHRLLATAIACLRYRPAAAPPGAEGLAPHVTVQLPLYNERFVAERLIRAAAALDYPRELLDIQVLDDSSDQTVAIVARLTEELAKAGLRIRHIRRPDRVGFKAGALAHGAEQAEGELIAIFDADFVPPPDYLRRIVPHFADPAVGMAQARWGHLNRGASLLTRVQAILLDAHFAIEQPARYASGAFFNFNGTAGVWRAQAIADAGGWQGDTLTEDLDLSYRAQLAGWRFVYLRELECPGELPGDMNAFKSQQHRWSKGAIEVMRKLLGRVWRAPQPLARKLEATAHLTSNLAYLLLFVSSVLLLPPSILLRLHYDLNGLWWLDVPLLALSTFSHLFFFLMGQKLLQRSFLRASLFAPALLATSVGLALNNGRAVLEGLLGHVSEFVRTPKQGDAAGARGCGGYRAAMSRWSERAELALGLFYAYLAAWSASLSLWSVTPFMVLFSLGFFYSGLSSLRLRWRAAPNPSPAGGGGKQ